MIIEFYDTEARPKTIESFASWHQPLKVIDIPTENDITIKLSPNEYLLPQDNYTIKIGVGIKRV